MKTKHLLLTFLMLLITTINYAQVTFTQSGIAVQGIVRDNNNSAITNGDPIAITFTIYYDDNGTIKNAFKQTETLTPDSFGVFSYVINVEADRIPLFSNFNMALKIESQISNNPIFTISDEPLKYVPYAISANNGVPAGSIMPFMGSTAPTGWALCDGSPLPTTATDLIAMVGANAPDLRGMFLRGAGTNSLTEVNTVLGGTQDDAFENHGHGDNFSVTSTDSEHSHSATLTRDRESNAGDDDDDGVMHFIDSSYNNDGTGTITTDTDGAHTHNLSGNVSTSTSGSSENRPVNYGVNYIIKL